MGMILRIEYICARCRTFTLRSSSHTFSTTSSKPTSKVPDAPARTRFAPSPTGNLHLGSLRTALFNYLLAKRTGGQFILRIEDTDEKRTVPGAEQKIYNDLRWAGLQWDEGPEVGGPYGPYRQSERTPLYKKHAEQLLSSGHAYRCFCTPEEIREKAIARGGVGQTVEYDGTCLHIPIKESNARASGGESFIVRMKDPHRNIEEMKPWTDLVYGTMKPRALAAKKRAGRDAFNDAILLKGDGRPTYHLANVVDDYYMKITHVVRGVEWLESTWQHVALYDALGWKPPAFAHVGLLMDEQKRKLSKRLREFDLDELKSSVLPETLMNFLALLGWKHKRDKEVFTMQTLMDSFDLDLNKTNPVVSLRKLYFLQPYHARSRVAEGRTLYEQLLNFTVAAATSEFNAKDLQSAGISTPEELRSRIDRALKYDISWISPMDFVRNHRYLFAAPVESDFSNSVPKKLQPLFADRDLADRLEQSVQNEVLSLVDDSTRKDSDLHHAVDDVVAEIVKEELNKAGLYAASDEIQQAEAMRVARHFVHYCLRQWLAGGMSGPGVVDLMLLLGSKVCRDRIALRVLMKDSLQFDHPKEAVAV